MLAQLLLRCYRQQEEIFVILHFGKEQISGYFRNVINCLFLGIVNYIGIACVIGCNWSFVQTTFCWQSFLALWGDILLDLKSVKPVYFKCLFNLVSCLIFSPSPRCCNTLFGLLLKFSIGFDHSTYVRQLWFSHPMRHHNAGYLSIWPLPGL